MIYFDHHAATPICVAAQRAMAAAHEVGWANPASVHSAGRAAKRLLEQARDQLADAVGAAPADIVFTSGGTEACELGIVGLAAGCSRIVSSTVEHPAVVGALKPWHAAGQPLHHFEVPAGVPPAAAALREVVDANTLLVVQWVNHETGTVFPVEDYAALCRDVGARLFVDASQALGKLGVDVSGLGAAAVALASHKIGGPSGAGALWLDRNAPWQPPRLGGMQERGRRPGTPDVIRLVGFGAAAGSLPQRLQAQATIDRERTRLESALLAHGAVRNAESARRVATVSNLSFEGRRAEHLVAALDLEGVCVSAGAACSSGLQEASPVLQAMYPDEQWRARSALRISLGPETSSDDIDLGLQAFQRVLRRPPQESQVNC